ncbi:hypothetical protein EV186_1021111 [Labedaea rhizosphaerae]|uniref:Uncharacterized protein n=1 Tax=Labedaea rhizosphaerae TaxID=598644 RepID=A0A4R6SHX0_LABRH|nr:hypothetical protein EV186_1021111 [Labedaea rhizosphaerae]
MAVIGQPLDQPNELRPGTPATEEVEQVNAELSLEVVLDRLAAILDQRNEADEPPGGTGESPKWSTMSVTNALSTEAGAEPTSSRTRS